jgi:hypothetical protein
VILIRRNAVDSIARSDGRGEEREHDEERRLGPASNSGRLTPDMAREAIFY